MRVSVVPDFMPLGQDAPNEVGMILSVPSYHEECRAGIVLAEDIQDLWGVFRVRPVIESQGNLMSCRLLEMNNCSIRRPLLVGVVQQ